MSLYNILICTSSCPRCGNAAEVEVNLYFGVRDLKQYRLNDHYPMGDTADIDGEGYAECPECKKDFFLKVYVAGDRIVAATPDPDKSGYIPD